MQDGIDGIDKINDIVNFLSFHFSSSVVLF